MAEGIRVSTNNFKYAAWYHRLAALCIDMAVVKAFVFIIFPGSLGIFTIVFGILSEGVWRCEGAGNVCVYSTSLRSRSPKLMIVPLMAPGRPSSFSLDEKEPKNQAAKILPPTRQNTQARVLRQAFARFCSWCR